MLWLKKKQEKDEIRRAELYSDKNSTKWNSPSRSHSKSVSASQYETRSDSKSKYSSSNKKSHGDKTSKQTFCDFLKRNEMWETTRKRKLQEHKKRIASHEKQAIERSKSHRRSRSNRNRNGKKIRD